MNSEKVKEIKTALEFMMKLDLSNKLPYIDGYTPKQIAYEEIFNYINELESEREYEVENQQLKYQIAELEEYIKGNEQDAKAFVKGWKKDLETELKQFAERLKEKCKELENKYSHLCKSKKEAMEETCRYQGVLAVKREIDETLKEFLEE